MQYNQKRNYTQTKSYTNVQWQVYWLLLTVIWVIWKQNWHRELNHQEVLHNKHIYATAHYLQRTALQGLEWWWFGDPPHYVHMWTKERGICQKLYKKYRFGSTLTKVARPSLSETTVGNDETMSSAVQIKESRSPVFPPQVLLYITCQSTRTRWRPVNTLRLIIFNSTYSYFHFISVIIHWILLMSDLTDRWR